MKKDSLQKIRDERRKWLSWKNIAPLREILKTLPNVECEVSFDDVVTVNTGKNLDLYKEAKSLMPWRKGPFKIDDLFIDSEWQSYKKYNLLKPHFDLKDKIVADVGCNNGYYMFRMLKEKPKKIVGFDPSALFMTQFDFINHFIKSDIVYELLGVEHVGEYEHKFDTIFCLGVLYHRSDPIGALKSLKRALNKEGELFVDTFMIDGDDDICLTPKDRYSKIPNIYFIPTVQAFKNWLYRAGFKSVKVLEITQTDQDEQRKTEWIEGESLGDFLDSKDPSKTVEGYPAPKRVYVRATLS